jgi:hypothetical protein
MNAPICGTKFDSPAPPARPRARYRPPAIRQQIPEALHDRRMDAADVLDLLLRQRTRPLAGAAFAEEFFSDFRPLVEAALLFLPAQFGSFLHPVAQRSRGPRQRVRPLAGPMTGFARWRGRADSPAHDAVANRAIASGTSSMRGSVR